MTKAVLVQSSSEGNAFNGKVSLGEQSPSETNLIEVEIVQEGTQFSQDNLSLPQWSGDPMEDGSGIYA